MQQPCNGQPSGTYFTGAACCDGTTPGGEGDDCEPSYNILGQCISCCDGGSGGGSGGGGNDDSGSDCTPQYNILGQCISCCG